MISLKKNSAIDGKLLRSLKEDGILIEHRIGERNIIFANNQTIVSVGLNVSSPDENLIKPPNINDYCWTRRASVEYAGGRARILGTPGNRDWLGHRSDVSGHYPRNKLAESLFDNPTTRCDNAVTEMDGIYGDAVLITNTRKYWCIDPYYTMTEEDIDVVEGYLTAPRRLIRRNSYDAIIMFLEMPYEEDLVALKLLAS